MMRYEGGMSVRLYSRKSKAVSDLSSSEDPVECRGATPWSCASDVAHSELYLLPMLIGLPVRRFVIIDFEFFFE